jgi:hypothetical protein
MFFPSLFLSSKLFLVFIKLSQNIFSNKTGNGSGILYHLISNQKIISIVYFSLFYLHFLIKCMFMILMPNLFFFFLILNMIKSTTLSYASRKLLNQNIILPFSKISKAYSNDVYSKLDQLL